MLLISMRRVSDDALSNESATSVGRFSRRNMRVWPVGVRGKKTPYLFEWMLWAAMTRKLQLSGNFTALQRSHVGSSNMPL